MKFVSILILFIFLGSSFNTPTIKNDEVEKKMYGTWFLKVIEPINDPPGMNVIMGMYFTLSPNKSILFRMTAHYEYQGKSVMATSIRSTGTWQVRDYKGKSYLVDELTDCKETMNKFPEVLSLCDDLDLLSSDDENPSEILFVNDKKLILKSFDETTQQEEILTFEKI